MGLAGATGIIGTLLFTRLRHWLGLERTGLIAFSAQLSCLTLAVASIWTPGSPFDIHYTDRLVMFYSVNVIHKSDLSYQHNVLKHDVCLSVCNICGL